MEHDSKLHREEQETCRHGHEEHRHGEDCHCHGHEEHYHGEGCHCHEHEDCGCGHDHSAPRGAIGRLIAWYGLGVLPIMVGFLPFLPTAARIVASAVGYALFGFSVWRDMLRGFAKRRIFTEFTLMCVASVGAFAIGEYADAAAVMYLYSLGEALSDSAYAASKRNISELLAVTPDYATVLREGKPHRASPEEVEIGEVILVLAGERIPLDGTVVEGGGFADTASVTGEAKPLALYEGVACPSGAVLQDGSVRIRVTERYEGSVVARLAEAVKEASGRKSAAEKKIARFARIFTPIAFAVASAVCLGGWLLTGDLATWLRAGLVILVVSCPCSMVLSVPLTYFAGIGAGAARGIVFRGGQVMDTVCRLDTVVFDKTGTLSESALRYDGAEVFGEGTEEAFLSLARDVLTHSSHVAARAFCAAYCGEGSAHTVSDVETVGGRGLICLADGKQALFGNAALLREHGFDVEDSPTTVIFGAWDGRLLGALRFSAHLKRESAPAVASLRQSGIGRIAVLSGDGEVSVAEACREAGIEEYYASLTPAQKVETFQKIEREQKALRKRAAVAYCGDGLNDSAVIAGADVGIAMGGCGSALTVSSADVVLMDDNPHKLAEALRLARRTSRIATQNIALSLGLKLAVLVIGILLSALTGTGIPMGIAIIADVGAAMLAVLNALRAAK